MKSEVKCDVEGLYKRIPSLSVFELLLLIHMLTFERSSFDNDKAKK